MKFLITILLISCQVLPQDVGTGHTHFNNDTVMVCYTNTVMLWKIKRIKNGVYRLEAVHNKTVIGVGKLEINGSMAIYQYSYIVEGYTKDVFVFFKIEKI